MRSVFEARAGDQVGERYYVPSTHYTIYMNEAGVVMVEIGGRFVRHLTDVVNRHLRGASASAGALHCAAGFLQGWRG